MPGPDTLLYEAELDPYRRQKQMVTADATSRKADHTVSTTDSHK